MSKGTRSSSHHATGTSNKRSSPQIRWIAVAVAVLGATALAVLAVGTLRDPSAPPTPPTAGVEWGSLPPAPLSARLGHSGVWTGSEFIVWGGSLGEGPLRSDGAAYDPKSRSWRSIPKVALRPRMNHAAVWTGRVMLIWGGDERDDGAAYDPAADEWRAIAEAPLQERYDPSYAWTGTELIIWGGRRGSETLNDGAAYNPNDDTWRGIAPPPIAPRAGAEAVWTGERFIVWGGCEPGPAPTCHSDGASYDPVSDSWTSLAPAPISGRVAHSMLWTGSEVLVWGGSDGGTGPGAHSDGAAFDPETATWRAIASWEPRSSHAAFWSGREMVVWGGQDGTGERATDGAVVDPASDSWVPFHEGPLSGRTGFAHAWTGSEWLIWGGFTTLDDGVIAKDGASLRLIHGSAKT